MTLLAIKVRALSSKKELMHDCWCLAHFSTYLRLRRVSVGGGELSAVRKYGRLTSLLDVLSSISWWNWCYWFMSTTGLECRCILLPIPGHCSLHYWWHNLQKIWIQLLRAYADWSLFNFFKHSFRACRKPQNIRTFMGFTLKKFQPYDIHCNLSTQKHAPCFGYCNITPKIFFQP